MDDDWDLGDGGSVPCEVCGRPVNVGATRLPGSSGLDTGSRVDNHALCKSCQSGRYTARKARGRR